MQQDKDPKHTAMEVHRAKNWNVLVWQGQPREPDPIEHACVPLTNTAKNESIALRLSNMEEWACMAASGMQNCFTSPY